MPCIKYLFIVDQLQIFRGKGWKSKYEPAKILNIRRFKLLMDRCKRKKLPGIFQLIAAIRLLFYDTLIIVRLGVFLIEMTKSYPSQIFFYFPDPCNKTGRISGHLFIEDIQELVFQFGIQGDQVGQDLHGMYFHCHRHIIT